MFAGGRRRTSNIRVKQLFYKLKQQFPTVPDHIVTQCISNCSNRGNPEGGSDEENLVFLEVIEAVAALRSVEDQELMGRTLTKPSDSTTSLSEPSIINQEPHVTEIFPKTFPSAKPSTDNAIISETRNTVKSEKNPTVIEPRDRFEMNQNDSDINRNVVKPNSHSDSEFSNVSLSASRKLPLQRPDHLDIERETDKSDYKRSSEGFNKIQPSKKYFDLQELLNAENLHVKPPPSPVSAKRPANPTIKSSPTKPDQSFRSPISPDVHRKISPLHGSSESVSASTSGFCSGDVSNSPQTSSLSSQKSESLDRRPETAETPTQTTETLLGSGSVNLSLNVNCQMDVLQSPISSRHTSVLQMTPQLPWLPESTSQRSYTSVNLTLRPPSIEPQAPIDITSQNSSLTYSTSSFDSQKGLQSRLQITVGPGGGSVSSLRTRPRSSYHPNPQPEDTVPVRAGSLPDLATESKSPVICKQEARIERLRIELITEKGRLLAMQEEIASLERPISMTSKGDIELEKQLQKEIRHLQGQCKRLAYDVDWQSESKAPLGETNEEFYRNIYTGQRGPFTLESFCLPRADSSRYRQGPEQSLPPQVVREDPKWNCHMCTFQNHPLLDKCEQCEMPRILHVSAAPGDNIHIHVTPRISRRKRLYKCLECKLTFYCCVHVLTK